MKELFEKLGVQVAEDADVDTIAEAIRGKVKEVLSHDPEFIEPIKADAIKKAEEKVIVAEKKAKKAFKAIAGIDLTNSEIDSLSLEDLYKTGLDKLKSATGSDAAKLQDEIISLGNALAAEKESKQSEISRILSEFKQKEVNAVASTEILKKLSSVELVIETEAAIDYLTTKLGKEGIGFDVENGTLVIKQGEYAMLKKDKTGKADVEYLISTYLQPFIKKSNGSGGAQGQQRNAPTGKNVWDNFGLTESDWNKLAPAYREAKVKSLMKSN